MSNLILGLNRALYAGSKYNILNRYVASSLLPVQVAKQIINTRNLYSDNALGLYKLDRIRDKKQQLFAGVGKDRYIERIRGYMDSGGQSTIFRDDLINLIGIAENEEHLDLLEKLVLSQYKSQPDEYEGWGSTLMRLYCRMNQLDRAYANLKDENFSGFFNQRISYRIVMTMLFKAQRYEDVIRVYELADQNLTQSPANMEQAEKHLALLAFAAYAKMNTPEAAEAAGALLSKLNTNSDSIGPLRSHMLVAYLAVNNGNYLYALNLTSKMPTRNYIALKELKIKSFIKLERYEDILIQLRDYSSSARRDVVVLLRSTYEMIQESIDKIENEDVRQEMTDILAELESSGHISDAKLEELLFKEIESERVSRPTDEQNTGQRNYRSRYQESSGERYRPRYQENSGDRYRQRGQDDGGNRYRPRGQDDSDNRYRSRKYDGDEDRYRARGPDDDYESQNQSRFRNRRENQQRKGLTYQNMDFS